MHRERPTAPLINRPYATRLTAARRADTVAAPDATFQLFKDKRAARSTPQYSDDDRR